MIGRPLTLITPEEYKAAYPEQKRAVLLIAINPGTGEVVTRYYEGNEDARYMSHDVVAFVYINGWSVTINEVALA